MIVFECVSKVLRLKFGQIRHIMTSVDLVIPSNRRIAVFGSSAEDVQILINLISGVTLPTSGRICRYARVSFPVGYLGSFNQLLSVRHNVAHVARLYDIDVQSTIQFVQAVSGLKHAFDRPFGRLSTRDKQRLARIVAYSLPFDLYIHTNDITNPGAINQLGERLLKLIEDRGRHAGILVPSRNLRHAQAFCDTGLILHSGRLHLIEDIADISPARLQADMAETYGNAGDIATLKKIFGNGFFVSS